MHFIVIYCHFLKKLKAQCYLFKLLLFATDLESKAILAMAKNDEYVNKQVSRTDFPPNFVFGVATSAYQVSYHTHHMHFQPLHLWKNVIFL